MKKKQKFWQWNTHRISKQHIDFGSLGSFFNFDISELLSFFKTIVEQSVRNDVVELTILLKKVKFGIPNKNMSLHMSTKERLLALIDDIEIISKYVERIKQPINI